MYFTRAYVFIGIYSDCVVLYPLFHIAINNCVGLRSGERVGLSGDLLKIESALWMIDPL
jgi:hypothetical protein